MTYEEILSELEGVRPSGAYHMARCPAHEDSTASLQVDEKDDGSLGVYCHAGCDTKDVMEALGYSLKDLFPESEEQVYVYRSVDGSYLYEKVRAKGEKHFTQRQLLPSGEYLYDLKGVPKTLYRIDEVKAALAESPNRSVFLVEGEKDADAVWANGSIGTTQGGASDWRSEYAELLEGYSVVICQDNDPPGRKTSTQMMLDLSGKAKGLFLREARAGKDISDHFRAGYTIDELVQPSVFRPIDFNEPPPQVRWLWEGLLAAGDLVLGVGPPKLGKSWLTQGLAVALANGSESFLGRHLRAGKVLYFDEENPLDVVMSRLLRLGLTNFPNLHYVAAGGLRLDTHPEKLMQETAMFQPSLIVIDSLARVHAKDENSFAEMSEILNEVLKPLARTTGAGVILIHHTDKSGRSPRGSSDIEAAVDSIISMSGTPGTGEFWISERGRRGTSNGSQKVEIVDLPGGGGVSVRAG